MTQPLNKNELIQAIEAADALIQKYKYNKITQYFPESGPYSRDKYPKQMELMRAGKNHNIRGFVGANGSGKTLWDGLEGYWHLSGNYPDWWDGFRFTRPIDAWMCGMDFSALAAGLQRLLFGGVGDDDIGTGIIPREMLLDDKGNLMKWAKQGSGTCIGTFKVRHYTNGMFDGYSLCEFMTYEKGWKAFQGANKDLIIGDEEPDDGKIFAECVARLRGRAGEPDGHLLWGFTPTDGFRDVYLTFVPKGLFPQNGVQENDPSIYTVQVTWEDVHHLSEAWKKSAVERWKTTDPNNIEARTKGIAAMGSGRVYPINEESVVVPAFPIPIFWRKAYGLDPGWNVTSAIWIAEDPNSRVKYIYSEYRGVKQIPVVHADGIKARGSWIAGGMDPHGAKHRGHEGNTVLEHYLNLGLEVFSAEGDSAALISMILGMFQNGSLKIMDSCPGLIEHIRMYRYSSTDPNKVEKDQDDHDCDAMKYGLAIFDMIAKAYSEIEEEQYGTQNKDVGDEGRSEYTGY